MTIALNEAIAFRPPRGQGTGEPGANNTVSVSSAATAAQSLGQGPNGSGFWITMVSTADAHVRFGTASVGAATTSDWPLRAGVTENFWCVAAEDTHFRAIRATADGTLHWFRSSR